MKNKKIIFWLSALVIGMAVIALDIFQSRQLGALQNDSRSITSTKNIKNKASEQKGKVLIVYFSRAGNNYPNTYLRIGHTHQMANWIADKTDGTKYEIVPQKAYPKNYNATVSRAEEEQNSNARPTIKNELPDLNKYDTVFLGYPIWNGELPMIVRTFLDNADLNDKTVIPFSSNAGSGWANTLSVIRKAYPKATIKKGFEVQGVDVDHSRDAINNWLNNLGY